GASSASHAGGATPSGPAPSSHGGEPVAPAADTHGDESVVRAAASQRTGKGHARPVYTASTMPVVLADLYPPMAQNDSYNVLHDPALTVAPAGVLANDYSPTGAPLSAVKVTNPTHGTVTVNSNGGFTYTPSNHWVGTDSFTYYATTGTANSAPAT